MKIHQVTKKALLVVVQLITMAACASPSTTMAPTAAPATAPVALSTVNPTAVQQSPASTVIAPTLPLATAVPGRAPVRNPLALGSPVAMTDGKPSRIGRGVRQMHFAPDAKSVFVSSPLGGTYRYDAETGAELGSYALDSVSLVTAQTIAGSATVDPTASVAERRVWRVIDLASNDVTDSSLLSATGIIRGSNVLEDGIYRSVRKAGDLGGGAFVITVEYGKPGEAQVTRSFEVTSTARRDVVAAWLSATEIVVLQPNLLRVLDAETGRLKSGLAVPISSFVPQIWVEIKSRSVFVHGYIDDLRALGLARISLSDGKVDLVVNTATSIDWVALPLERRLIGVGVERTTVALDSRLHLFEVNVESGALVRNERTAVPFSGFVVDLTASEDGRKLGLISLGVLNGRNSGLVQVMDRQSLKVFTLAGHSQATVGAFAVDDQLVGVSGGSAWQINPRTGAQTLLFGDVDGLIRRAAVSAMTGVGLFAVEDRETLPNGTQNIRHTYFQFGPKPGAPRMIFTATQAATEPIVSISDDGRRAAVLTSDGLQVFAPETPAVPLSTIKVLADKTLTPSHIAFSADGTLIAVAYRQQIGRENIGPVDVFDTNTATRIRRIAIEQVFGLHNPSAGERRLTRMGFAPTGLALMLLVSNGSAGHEIAVLGEAGANIGNRKAIADTAVIAGFIDAERVWTSSHSTIEILKSTDLNKSAGKPIVSIDYPLQVVAVKGGRQLALFQNVVNLVPLD